MVKSGRRMGVWRVVCVWCVVCGVCGVCGMCSVCGITACRRVGKAAFRCRETKIMRTEPGRPGPGGMVETSWLVTRIVVGAGRGAWSMAAWRAWQHGEHGSMAGGRRSGSAALRVCRTPVFDVEEDEARIGGEGVEEHEI